MAVRNAVSIAVAVVAIAHAVAIAVTVPAIVVSAFYRVCDAAGKNAGGDQRYSELLHVFSPDEDVCSD
jgi:Na+(H+)/acetate symporter ActP